MKNTFILFIILFVAFGQAQYEKGIIHLKNGDSLTGLIKIKNISQVKFKDHSESKATTYGHENITGFDLMDEGQFRFKKYKKGFPPKIFELLKAGKMNLYLIQGYNAGLISPNGFIHGRNTYDYYIETFGKFIKLGPRLKQKDFFYFSACPGLVNKIKNKEFKRNDIYGIVNYFNLHYYDEK